MKALEGETAYRFTGPHWKLLEYCGFHVRVFKPRWLATGYDILVTVKHTYEDPESTVLMPMNSHDVDSIRWLLATLLDTQRDKLYALLATGFALEACHDEPLVLQIREAKERAIIDQRFDDAANWRDQERKLQR